MYQWDNIYSDEIYDKQLQRIIPGITDIIVNYACEYVFHIKIVSTFATVMMKYIFCILLGVFLNWGFHLISDEAQEAYRLETGSTSIQTYTKSYTSKTNILQLDKEQK